MPRSSRLDAPGVLHHIMIRGIERRNELSWGGLMRSHGGWAEVRKHGLKGQSSIKSDERILRKSDFVADVLSQATRHLI
ncbi:MAG: hypothetical protein BA865_07295 [Desulfobacterales bacterium S5133MH4]|nr:MAG: hypothetical protein BA865_07295 [Desulfobacterales bacterium S5133MH4]